MWETIGIVLSAIIVVIGTLITFFPKKYMLWVKPKGISIEEADIDNEEKVKVFKKAGIPYLIIGLIWLVLDLNGFGNINHQYNDQYQIFLSLSIIFIGFLLMKYPINTPLKEAKANEEAEAKAKKGGKILMVMGIIFLIIDILFLI